VAHVREMTNTYKFWSEKLRWRDHSEELGVDGSVLLEWILGKQYEKTWTGVIWLRIGTNSHLLCTR